MQAKELIAQASVSDGAFAVPPLFLLGHLANVALCACLPWEDKQHLGLAKARDMTRQWHSAWAPATEGLERYLQQEGFDPLPTAAELRTLPLLLAATTGKSLADNARAAGEQKRAWELAQEAADAYRQLVALHPSRPILKLQLSGCLVNGPPSQHAAAVAALREAFRQADASTGGLPLAAVSAVAVGERSALALMLLAHNAMQTTGRQLLLRTASA